MPECLPLRLRAALALRSVLILVASLLGPALGAPAMAQSEAIPAAPSITPGAAAPNALQIAWSVRNRFRLFREERDFQLHVEALAGRSILQSEQALAELSEGRGWARNALGRLCIDLAGNVSESCTRDGVKESYLAPDGHRIMAHLSAPVPAGTTCLWTFDDGQSPPQQSPVPCNEPVSLRVRYGKPTIARVNVVGPDFPEQNLTTDIAVRDFLIAGLGDSIASGEGNPDRPVLLANEGFCFRSYLGAEGQYFRPSRAGFTGSRACDGTIDVSGALTANWQKRGAQWLHAPCHRSLYSYQVRTALALAVANPHIAVTFLPLACTGATIEDGLLNKQNARDCPPASSDVRCRGSVPPQLAQLKALLANAARIAPSRKLDLMLLSIGANDIDFSGLVADIMVEGKVERTIFRRAGVIGTVADSRTALTRTLPTQFMRLRENLKSFVDGDLSRVVFVSYANPALASGGTCSGGRDGFDIHPAFSIDGARLQAASDFVENEFLPQLAGLATCTNGALCRNPAAERMTLVDAHQPQFARHGVCARGDNDPEFDQACFSKSGESFQSDPVNGATDPLICGRKASEFRPYAKRQRWIRTANDSYFSAMTFPQGVSSALQPTDIHDATWGILSAVYGGAVHPTAEGHAAMADAAFTRASAVLGLRGVTQTAPVDAISPRLVPALNQN